MILAVSAVFEAFRAPMPAARPQVWWHWMNNCVNPSGITNELRAIAKAGFGGVHLFNAGWVSKAPQEPVTPFLSEGWKANVRAALGQCRELGLDFFAQNGAGWSGSGGTWVAASNAMLEVYTTERRMKGGETARIGKPDVRTWSRVFPRKGPRWYGDIAVLAFPLVSLKTLDSSELRDITDRMDAEGVVEFAAPDDGRDWVLLRVGCRPNGRVNDPSPEGSFGPVGSLFDRAVTEDHLRNYFELILNEDRALGGGIVKGLLLDSWESDSQNWSRNYAAEFQRRRGYAVRDVLPTYAGYVVDDPARTAQLKTDARLTVDELLKENYFDVIADYCRRHGLKQIVEGFACGAGVFDGEPFTPYFSCDIPMTESGRVTEAVTSAHLRDIPEVAYEAHTGRANWDLSPRDFKRNEDRQFLKGITRLVMHTYAHNATPERHSPGPAFGSFGGCFQLGQTWWPFARAWTDYLSRCQALLSRGRAVTDVLVVSDRITADRPVGLPAGYSCDFISSRYFSRISPMAKQRYRMIVTEPTADAFAEMDFAPDLAVRGLKLGSEFGGVHRIDGTTDIYFVCRRVKPPDGSEMGFRVTGKKPYVLDPLTGEIYACHAGYEADGYTWLPMIEGSAAEASRIVVFADGKGGLSSGGGNEGRTKAVDGRFSDWSMAINGLGCAFACRDDVFFDWATREETRGYSGTGVYRARFDVSAALTTEGRFRLRLGRVDVASEVFVDGASCGVAWCEPYEVDVTDAVKGKRSFAVELHVVNTWRNRLIADAKRPKEERLTWTTATGLKPADAPSAAGLQGPVTLVEVTGAEYVEVCSREDSADRDGSSPDVILLSSNPREESVIVKPVLSLSGRAEYPGFFYGDEEVVFPVLLKPGDSLPVAADGIWQLRSANGELRAAGRVRPLDDLSKIRDQSSCNPKEDNFTVSKSNLQ